jgi:Peptidase_C39 like family
MRMLTRRGTALLLAAIVALGAAGAAAYYWRHRGAWQVRALPRTAATVRAPSAVPSRAPIPISTPTPTLPPSLLLQTVPFTVQAPFGWDAAHEEYCEAAAIYMSGQFLMRGDNRADIPPAEADAAMGKIVTAERAAFPGAVNLSLEQMIQMGAQAYPGMHGQVVPASLSSIERYLAGGLPVMLPVMTHGGPGGTKIYPTYGYQNVYHVLVIVGYDAGQNLIYANDSGLREGKDLSYQWSTLAVANQAQATTPRDESGAAVPTVQGQSMLIFSQ